MDDQDHVVNIVTTASGAQMVFQSDPMISISVTVDDDPVVSEQAAIMDAGEFQKAMKKKTALAIDFDTISGRATLMQKTSKNNPDTSAKDAA